MYGNNENILEPLKGGKLKGIHLKIDNALILEIDDYFILMETEGDCCSETYISDIIKNISLPSYPINNWDSEISFKIHSIEEIGLQEGEYISRKSRQEEDEIYGIKINIECEGDKPNCITIVYRNSSNGYYGGSMNISKHENIDMEGFREIQYDFHNPF